ncbi:hypothetical protein ACOSP7_001341 [Xanthoceras sorbifolium]
MGNPLLLSLSLTLLLLFHGSLASRMSSQQQQQQQQNKCQIDRLDTLEPSNRVENEAGVIETWDPNHEQSQCSGVAVVRSTLQQNGLVLPSYSNTHQVIYVIQGEGVMGTIIPGCPGTYQSPQQGSQRGQHRGSFQDQHQKLQRFRAGDILVVPAGTAYWSYNDGQTPVIAVSFIDLANDANQLDTNPRKFYLAGNQQDEFQQQDQQSRERVSSRGKGQQQQSSCNNIFCGFDPQILSEAFNVDQSLIEKLQNDDDNRGAMVKVKGELQVIKPPRSSRQTQTGRQEESEEREREAQMLHGSRGINGIEETICSMRLRENVGDPSRADIYSPEVGRLVTLDSNNLPILSWLQLSVERGTLLNRALMSPHWNLNAHSIMYALQGSAYVQVVDNNGNSVFDGEFSQGQVLTVPQNFAVVKRATGQKFEWIAMRTNQDAMLASLAGETSVLRSIPQQVLANAFDISNEEASRLKCSTLHETVLSRGRSSQMSMTVDA